MKQINLFFLLTYLLSVGCEPKVDREKVIIDVPAIVNKAPKEVEQLVGKPDSTYSIYMAGREIPAHYYKKKGVEIQYWNGKATDIVVQEPMPLPFEPSTLEAFGVLPSEPTSQSKNVALKWNNKPGFKMINFYALDYDQNKNVSKYRIFFKAK